MKTIQQFLQEEHCFSCNGVTIRELRQEDAHVFGRMFKGGMKEDAARVVIETLQYKRKKGTFICLAIMDEMDVFSGVIELYDLKDSSFEIGYRMCFDRQGKKICTRAVGWVAAYLKQYGFTILRARVHQDHEASRHILLNNGFEITECRDEYMFLRLVL